MNATTIGLDIAKNVFQAHGVDAEGEVVTRCLSRAVMTSTREARATIDRRKRLIGTEKVFRRDEGPNPAVFGHSSSGNFLCSVLLACPFNSLCMIFHL